jgi:Tol biopolymer transport system component
MDGKLTDLRQGDSPVVLRKSKKILFEDTDSGLWRTCELDGTKPEIYADGMKGYDTPAVSPDESQIIFAKFEKGKLPRLMLFDWGDTNGKPIVNAGGFTGIPVWR